MLRSAVLFLHNTIVRRKPVRGFRPQQRDAIRSRECRRCRMAWPGRRAGARLRSRPHNGSRCRNCLPGSGRWPPRSGESAASDARCGSACCCIASMRDSRPCTVWSSSTGCAAAIAWASSSRTASRFCRSRSSGSVAITRACCRRCGSADPRARRSRTCPWPWSAVPDSRESGGAGAGACPPFCNVLPGCR